jgi:RNA polymerase sigma factor (sigma-70 family)
MDNDRTTHAPCARRDTLGDLHKHGKEDQHGSRDKRRRRPTLCPERHRDYLDSETERRLISISRLARLLAQRIVPADVADDLSQEIVLECLEKARNERSIREIACNPRIVRAMVRRRAIDRLRRTQRRDARQRQYVQDLEDSTPSWMQPDMAVDEQELALLHAQTTAGLSPMCRRVHTMVREEGWSYARVGATLRISRSAVCRHVVNAQHRFRERLEAHGYTPVRAPRSARSARRRRLGRKSKATQQKRGAR